MSTIYKHGTIAKYREYSVSVMKIYFDFGDDQGLVSKTFAERELKSFLVRTYDKDHHEIYNIYRGKIISISTVAVRSCSPADYPKYTTIKLDCSKDNQSIVVDLKLSDIADVNDIDYEYEEMKPTDYQIPEFENWVERDKHVSVNLKSGTIVG